jgi:hypothetical protein
MRKLLLVLFLLVISAVTLYDTRVEPEIRKAIPIKKVHIDRYGESKKIAKQEYLKTIEPPPFKVPEISYESNNKGYKISVGIAEGWLERTDGSKNPVGVQVSISW